MRIAKSLFLISVLALVGCGSAVVDAGGNDVTIGVDASGSSKTDVSNPQGKDTSTAQKIDVSSTSNVPPKTGCASITIYHDTDGDGYGSNASAILHCADQPIASDWTTAGGDCNDAPWSEGQKGIEFNGKSVGFGYFVHPNAEDLCDHYDENCNGITDEGCPTNADCLKNDAILGADPNPYMNCVEVSAKCLTVTYSCQPWSCLPNETCLDKNGNGLCDTCVPKKTGLNSCPNACSDNDPYTWSYCNQEDLVTCESEPVFINILCYDASCVPFAWISNPDELNSLNLNYELLQLWDKGSSLDLDPKKFCEALAQPNAVLRVNALVMNKTDKSIKAIGGSHAKATDFLWWASGKNPKQGKPDVATLFDQPDSLFFFNDFPVCVAAKKEVEASGGTYPPLK